MAELLADLHPIAELLCSRTAGRSTPKAELLYGRTACRATLQGSIAVQQNCQQIYPPAELLYGRTASNLTPPHSRTAGRSTPHNGRTSVQQDSSLHKIAAYPLILCRLVSKAKNSMLAEQNAHLNYHFTRNVISSY